MKTRIQKCQKCNGAIGPVFYVVKVAQAVVDYGAVQRHAGLMAMMGGNAAIADVFSPERSLETVIEGDDANAWNEAIICQKCGVESEVTMLALQPKETSEVKS
jgi:hypothetical protein